MALKHLNTKPKTTATGMVLTVIPKRHLDTILYYLVMKLAKARQTDVPLQSSHRYFVSTYYKSFQVLNRLKGTALSLAKTQFIKKPKNPV